MAGAVFVIRYTNNSDQFAEAFLASADFEMDVLRKLARQVGVSAGSNSKADLINLITRNIRTGYQDSIYLPKIVQLLVARPKESIAVKTGSVKLFPALESGNTIVVDPGRETWYGPIVCPDDAVEARWYIRPQLVDYWDLLPGETDPKALKARWLCFARVTESSISLHWKGFTYPNGPDGVVNSAKRVQFPYWTFIPKFFDEIQEITQAKVEYVDLHNLLIHHLWDRYLEDGNFKWTHTRIRAESSGVSLNAHAGISDNDLNVNGILHLAQTIRIAVQRDLSAQGYFIQSPGHIDNTILRTLIREYGALSYGFTLEEQRKIIFKAHSYFGLKPTAKSPDSFPHIQVTYSDCNALEQLQFVLLQAKDMSSNGNREPRTLPLF